MKHSGKCDYNVFSMAFPYQRFICAAATLLLPALAVAEQSDPSPPEALHEPAQEAQALEMSDVSGLAMINITSDPAGSQVSVDGKPACQTPCRLSLLPGKHTLTFRHRKREELETDIAVASGELSQFHGVLGEDKPWTLILPTYFVGVIFAAGGISSILVHGSAGLGSTELPADERRFHRNLGIASVAIGLPLLGLATFLAFKGKPGEMQVSAVPRTPVLSLAPLTDSDGSIAGGSMTLMWN